jgi:hypothetical protein
MSSDPLARAATIALVALAAGCGTSQPQSASGGVWSGAQCSLSGSERVRGDLYAAATGDDVLAEIPGLRVGVVVSQLAPPGSTRAKVRLRADALGPTLTLDGWVDLSDLKLYARRDVQVLEDHVWISRGAPLVVLAGDRERVRVQAQPYPQGFDDLSTETTCDALALESEVRAREPGRKSRGAAFHPKAQTLSLYDETGKLVRPLRAHRFEVVTVNVVEQRSGMGRVAYDDFLRVDGWVKMSDLAPGPGADCDDCRGGVEDVPDVCFGHPIADLEANGCISHGERLVVAKRDTLVHREGSDGSPVIGKIDRGARVYVVNNLGPWVQIAPSTGALSAPDHLGFWVKRDEIL